MRRRVLVLAASVIAQACTRAGAPAPAGTAADSAAAAAFRGLMAATPGATRYCLAIGNAAFYRDPQGGAPSVVAPSARLVALVTAARPPGSAPAMGMAECERAREPSGTGLIVSHLLPLGDSAVHVTATASSAAGAFMYGCRVRRTRAGWAADPCRRTGVFD